MNRSSVFRNTKYSISVNNQLEEIKQSSDPIEDKCEQIKEKVRAIKTRLFEKKVSYTVHSRFSNLERTVNRLISGLDKFNSPPMNTSSSLNSISEKLDKFEEEIYNSERLLAQNTKLGTLNTLSSIEAPTQPHMGSKNKQLRRDMML
jgi:phage shock protein A